MDKDYARIIKKAKEIHDKSPYGDLWQQFSSDELRRYAAIKLKRAILVSDLDKTFDDCLDVLNIIIFAIRKLEIESGNRI